MKRILITGANGFTGQYVCKALENSNWEIYGLSDNLSITGKTVDLREKDLVYKIIKEVRPNAVIHLAAISSVNHKNIDEIYEVNILGTRNLLEALSYSNSDIENVILASSANIYGPENSGLPISELAPPNPVNDYAISKLAMELMAKTWFDRLPISITRPFNYTGVGQSENFIIPKIINAFRNNSDFLELGNIDISRDFSDVRDIASFYVSLLKNKYRNLIVNFCSGKSTSVSYIIDYCAKITGKNVEIVTSQSLIRKRDISSLTGDNRLLKEITGASGKYSIEQTLSWMLNNHKTDK